MNLAKNQTSHPSPKIAIDAGQNRKIDRHGSSNLPPNTTTDLNHAQQNVRINNLIRSPNSTASDQIGSALNINNAGNQSLILNYPGFTHNLQPSQATSIPTDQPPTTSIQQHSSTINPSIEYQRTQNDITPMENDNGDDYIQVNRKKKKVKITHIPSPSDSSTSSFSTSTSKSTSSTNSSSIITNVNTTSNVRSNTIPITDMGGSTNVITQQARRYAVTRFPFPPFIINFEQNVMENLIIEDLMDHFVKKYNFKLYLVGHRLKGKKEVLLFVGNRESFLMLYDNEKWPLDLNSYSYNKTHPNHLPPQFSIIMRNVPTDYNMSALLAEINEEYPDVCNANRLSNKAQQQTSFVRLDINNIETIDNLLRKKYIYLNNMRFSISEYIAPAKVLVCTKCFQIGHFRSTCKSLKDRCRTCGEEVEDTKSHKEVCDKQVCCIRCKGSHNANDIKCPEIMSYRAMLTKSLLSTTGGVNHQRDNQYNHQIQQQQTPHDFPILRPVTTNYTNKTNNETQQLHDTSKRIDELDNNIRRLDDNLNRLIDLNNNYCSQINNIQNMILNHDHVIQIQHSDLSFQQGLISQFIYPVCQVMIEIIPMLVQQNTINNKTLLCTSLTTLCAKLADDIPLWTNKYTLNENFKTKLINDLKANTGITQNSYNDNNVIDNPVIEEQ